MGSLLRTPTLESTLEYSTLQKSFTRISIIAVRGNNAGRLGSGTFPHNYCDCSQIGNKEADLDVSDDKRIKVDLSFSINLR
jgi:hypothetical protein